MMKALKRVSATNVAYVCLMLAFVALGTFVYALAAGSYLAGGIGLGLVVMMSAAVVGFRIGARKVAESDESGNPVNGANIWAQPVRQEQIDRYLLRYRGQERPPSTAKLPRRTASVGEAADRLAA